jgi:hypothetical protein
MFFNKSGKMYTNNKNKLQKRLPLNDKYYNLVIAILFLLLNLTQHCGTSEVLEFEFESEFILFNL